MNSLKCIVHSVLLLVSNCVSDTLSRCQTYEGGFAGCPGMEAHGGYSFCGLAALVMLGRQHLCDLLALLASYSVTALLWKLF